MPLRKAPRQGAGAVDHLPFLDARRNMHLANIDLVAAASKLDDDLEKKSLAHMRHYALRKEVLRRKDPSVAMLQELDAAEHALSIARGAILYSEGTLQMARSKYIAASAKCENAKARCVRNRCPEKHDSWPGDLDPEERRLYEGYGSAEFIYTPSARHFRRPVRKRPRLSDYKIPESMADPEPEPRPRPAPPPAAAPSFAAAMPSYTILSDSERWLQAVQDAFKDYTTLTKDSFPSPPGKKCTKQACKAESRALAACACDIRKLAIEFKLEQLKQLRWAFHPDKFSRCRPDLVSLFEKQASEVFVVVQAMYYERVRGMAG